MNKYRSFQLPRSSFDEPNLITQDVLNEQAAQQSLFQISKIEDPIVHNDYFFKSLNKLSPSKKSYDKYSISLPKRSVNERMPIIPTFHPRQTYGHAFSSNAAVNITNYVVIDERKVDDKIIVSARTNKYQLQERINRKAKLLFRSKNRDKLPSLGKQIESLSMALYCSKLNSKIIHN